MRPMLLSERDRAVLRGFATRIDPADAGAHNNLGVLYYHKGMTEDAVQEFRRALVLDPRMSIAEGNLRTAFCDSGLFERTASVLRQRLATDPADHATRRELADTYLLAGDHQRAAPELAALVVANPEDVNAVVELARAEQRLGDLEDAARWAARALELRPADPELYFLVADIAYHRGLNDEALAALQRVLRDRPEHADALYLMGFVLGDLGRHDEARDATRHAMRINPSLGRAQANLSLGHGASAPAAASGMPAGILEMVPHAGGALAHFNLGLAFRQRGYYAEALREYRLALQHGEDRALVTQAMAEVHLLRQEAAAAVELYDALLQEQVESPKLWNERGVALHQLGRIADACASYERSVSADPRYALALNNLAVAHYHAGRNDLSCEAFRRALGAQPAFVQARLNLALLLFKQKELSLCLEAYRQVLGLEPEHPVAWNGVGLVLAEMRQFGDARNAFARAIEARSDYAEAHYNLSFALSNLGDFQGGLRETKRALELDAFYVPQKFELTIDLQYENPRLAVSPDLGASQRPEGAVADFALDVRALETLFDELAPAAVPNVDGVPGHSAYAAARTALATGELDRATAETTRVLSGGGARLEGLVLLGDIFVRQGAFGEALDRYRQARAIDPSAPAPLAGEIRAQILLGRSGEARELAEALASRAAEDVDALLLVARVRSDAGDHEAAFQALDEARRLAPARADVLKLSGDLARAIGDDARAVAAYQQAVALDRGFAAARVDLAALYVTLGASEMAERELEAALDALPTYVDAALELAALRRGVGRAAETIDLLVGVLSRDPYHFDALVSLGESLFLCDRRADASVAVARVLRFDADHVGALYFEGVLLGKQHRYDEAVTRWQRVMDLEPASAFARRARRDMRTALDLRRIFTVREHRGAA